MGTGSRNHSGTILVGLPEVKPGTAFATIPLGVSPPWTLGVPLMGIFLILVGFVVFVLVALLILVALAVVAAFMGGAVGGVAGGEQAPKGRKEVATYRGAIVGAAIGVAVVLVVGLLGLVGGFVYFFSM